MSCLALLIEIPKISPFDEFGSILFIAVWAGALGGIISTFNIIPLKDVMVKGWEPYGSCRRLAWCTIVGAFFGSGAAIGFLGILCIDGKFDASLTDKTKIITAASSVVAGFLGIRLLRRLGDSLEKKVDALQDEAKQTKQSLAEAIETGLAKERANATKLASALSLAAINLSKDEKSQNINTIQDSIKQLEDLRPEFPEIRSVGIFLGRLYRRQKQYQKGIDVLLETLKARRDKNITEGEDDATLRFNAACYFNLLAEEVKTEPAAEQYRKKAWEHLQKCVDLCPSFIEQSKKDPDLTSLEKNGVRSFSDFKGR